MDIYLLFCLAMVVFLAFIALLIVSTTFGGKTDTQRIPSRPSRSTHQGWQSWIGLIGISLVIAMWTLWGALFFLAVVWLLRQNPEPDASFTLSDSDRKTAKIVYGWLLFSPLLTVPVFIVSIIYLTYGETSATVRGLEALIPLIFHLPLLWGLTSKNTFVFRHTQQCILLIALRAGMAILASSISSYSEIGFWLFLLGNGSLWLLGSTWGWNQVSRGECRWMEQNGEKLIASESTQVDSPQMDEELEDLLKSLNAKDKLTAKTKALNAFRSGIPETKKRAVEVLSKLGEVEQF